jgi:hypothetical protein
MELLTFVAAVAGFLAWREGRRIRMAMPWKSCCGGSRVILPRATVNRDPEQPSAGEVAVPRAAYGQTGEAKGPPGSVLGVAFSVGEG